MKSLSVIILGVFAAATVGQVTITPTTICRGSTCTSPGATGTCAQTTRTVFVPTTQTTTTTSTETRVVTQTRSVTATLIQTTTLIRTETRTTTVQNCAPAPSCPTLTSTGTACRTCLVPGCVTTQVVTKSCGCPNALATTTTNFPCNDRDSCNQIGCKTVYSVETQRC
ncbi:hypothetical protein CONLIGDRAFT_687521 [Coniochaeta ligniaria NRRL 30616]|uniref:TNFR-Cys domain-containing protein n=1 Tax=Coniochaeta ligniaria NRRL 30616 TaxID=1408157 RepID=A0A1J7I4Q6_9PEZI|nr:hypothetical protein CONLIGDRAFT_687521 [Coniochaeta ligniaria NRRL 30616]